MKDLTYTRIRSGDLEQLTSLRVRPFLTKKLVYDYFGVFDLHFRTTKDAKSSLFAPYLYYVFDSHEKRPYVDRSLQKKTVFANGFRIFIYHNPNIFLF
jgi:hypothetical protein